MTNENVFNMLFYPTLITLFYLSYEKGNEIILSLLFIIIVVHIINDSGITNNLSEDINKFYCLMKDIFAIVFGIVFIYFGLTKKLYLLLCFGIIMILVHVYYLFQKYYVH